MIGWISKNETRLDNILSSIKELENALAKFKANKKDLYLLNKYYGSKVWNMNEEIKDLIKQMKEMWNVEN